MYKKITEYPILSLSLSIFIMIIIYFGFLQSDIYTSETTIIVKTSSSGNSTTNIGNILSGASGEGMSDLLLIEEIITSPDTAIMLNNKYHLIPQYSSNKIDFFSRLHYKSNEQFYYYYLNNIINVEADTYHNVLKIKISSYVPDLATKILRTLVSLSEQKINSMNSQLSNIQSSELENKINSLYSRIEKINTEIIMASRKLNTPSVNFDMETSLGKIRNMTEALNLTSIDLKTKETFLAPNNPEIINLKEKIKIIKESIAQEKKHLLIGDNSLLNNQVNFENIASKKQLLITLYDKLNEAAEEMRMSYISNMKKVITLQEPTHYPFPLEPYRIYNIVLATILLIILSLILKLIILIVKDHTY